MKVNSWPKIALFPKKGNFQFWDFKGKEIKFLQEDSGKAYDLGVWQELSNSILR